MASRSADPFAPLRGSRPCTTDPCADAKAGLPHVGTLALRVVRVGRRRASSVARGRPCPSGAPGVGSVPSAPATTPTCCRVRPAGSSSPSRPCAPDRPGGRRTRAPRGVRRGGRIVRTGTRPGRRGSEHPARRHGDQGRVIGHVVERDPAAVDAPRDAASYPERRAEWVVGVRIAGRHAPVRRSSGGHAEVDREAVRDDGGSVARAQPAPRAGNAGRGSDHPGARGVILDARGDGINVGSPGTSSSRSHRARSR